jgi:SAM-dependent MidA family methyltransferase
MGIIERVEQLLSRVSSEEESQKIVKSTERLLTGDMGEKFKVMSIVHPSISPPGFE